ncbi:MAG: alpha/beta fold hydrolase, partial [Longimicrobiales bacterium]
DAVGSESAALFGYSEGGPMSILFAATHPSRTSARVCSMAPTQKRQWAPDYPWAPTPEARQRWLAMLEAEGAPLASAAPATKPSWTVVVYQPARKLKGPTAHKAAPTSRWR